MLNMLHNEWIKIRCSKILIWSFFGVIILPLLIIVMVKITYNAEISLMPDEYIYITLRFYLNVMSLLFFAVIAGEIMNMEFENDTLKMQLSLPISKTQFLLAKLLALSIYHMVLTVIMFVMSLVFAMLVTKHLIEFKQLEQLFFLYIKSGFLILPYGYFTVLMVLYFKNIIMPITINTGLFFIINLFSSIDMNFIFPWKSPLIIMLHESTNMIQAYSFLFVLTSVSIVLSHNRLNKIDL